MREDITKPYQAVQMENGAKNLTTKSKKPVLIIAKRYKLEKKKGQKT